MLWTPLAEESWDALFEPHRRLSPVARARELLDQIEHDPGAMWKIAEEISVPEVSSRTIRRTLIEAGTPSLWIYWSLDSGQEPIVLDFLFDD